MIDKALNRAAGAAIDRRLGRLRHRHRRAARRRRQGSPYLLGEQFTAADVVIGSGLRWGMLFKLLPELPEFVAYVAAARRAPRVAAANCAQDEELRAAGESG